MAKNKRVRSEIELIPIPRLKEADDLLKEMGKLQAANAEDDISATVRINQIKTTLTVNINARNERIEKIVRSIEAFAVNNPDVFEGKRSLKLNFGIFGWRKSTSLKTKKTTLDLIKQVFKGKQAAALVRVKETVDKDALAKLTDDQLASVEAQRIVTDAFFAEPAFNETKDTRN